MAAAMLLAVLMVGETSANSGGVPETSAEIVTYEVAPKEIVTREVAPNEVVIKEISPQEVAKRKRASKEAARQQVTRLEGTSGEIPDLATFLDRLMLAESSGRDTAANPLSTALGPFQFIKSTFLDIARRHFPQYYADLSDEQVLALRTTRHFARAAAAAYTLENAAHLKGEGHEPSWPHLRLAFLLGPVGASRVLQAAPDTPLSQVLGASVLQANPFMNGMTVTGLVARAARDIGAEVPAVAARGETDVLPRPEARLRPSARPRPGTPAVSATPNSAAVAGIKIRCSQLLTSCQRWIALQQLKHQRTRNAQGDAIKRKKSSITRPSAGA
jgi:hypothetical protein